MARWCLLKDSSDIPAQSIIGRKVLGPGSFLCRSFLQELIEVECLLSSWRAQEPLERGQLGDGCTEKRFVSHERKKVSMPC